MATVAILISYATVAILISELCTDVSLPIVCLLYEGSKFLLSGSSASDEVVHCCLSEDH